MRPATNTVWLSPGATSFSCICERCLDSARIRGASFLNAVSNARLQGSVAAETDVAFARCSAGHEVVLRRIEGPLKLTLANERQLQLQ